MGTIGQIPRKTQAFFRGVVGHFSGRAFRHFWRLVLAMTIGCGSTFDRLTKMLRGSTHRTNHGEFLWRSNWDESTVRKKIALDTLRHLRRKDGGKCYLILDKTQTLSGPGWLASASSTTTPRASTGLATRWSRHACGIGVTIPWGTGLCLRKEDARKEEEVFLTQTELAALVIHNANLPRDLDITVLFDSYYLCDVVVNACHCRGWHYIGAGKSNRNFTVDGQKKKLDGYGRNALGRDGQ